MGLIANIPKQGAVRSPRTSLNSDLAFKGNYAFAGNYNGFMVYDITQADPAEGRHPGRSAPAPRTTSRCGATCWSSASTPAAATTPAPAPRLPATNKEAWEGVRVFDISDPATRSTSRRWRPPAARTPTRWRRTSGGRNLYVYVSSYFPNATFPDCQPPHDKISVVKVPGSAPDAAYLVGDPGAVPRRRHTRRRLLDRDQPAATTSPPTRSATSRPVRAWATAS